MGGDIQKGCYEFESGCIIFHQNCVHCCLKKLTNSKRKRNEDETRKERNKGSSVTRKKSPNVYKSCPKMISLEK